MIIKKGSIVKLINTSELDWYKNGDKFIAIEDDCCPYCVFPEDYNPEYVYKDYVDHYIPITAFMHYKLEIIGNVFTGEEEEEKPTETNEVIEEETKPTIELTHTNEKKEGKKMWAAITMGALLVTAFGLIIYDLKTNK